MDASKSAIVVGGVIALLDLLLQALKSFQASGLLALIGL